MDIFNDARMRVWKEQPAEFFDEAFIDADGTLAPGGAVCKQGVDIAHDGTWGYHPLVVSLANTCEPPFLVNRSGNRPSHEQAAAAIREVGIRPNEEGCIFPMKNWEIAGKVALNQVSVSEFALFGIVGSLRVGADRVAGLTSKLHGIHRKPIPPDRLVWLGEFRAIPAPPPPRVAGMLRRVGSGPITVGEQRQWSYTLPTIEQIKRDT